MGRRPTQGPLWTEDEDMVLVTQYRAYGARRVQRILARTSPHPRTISSIWHRARRLGLSYDPVHTGKYIHLMDAHPDNIGRDHVRKAKAHRHIVAAAEADGVLRREEIYPFRPMAPVEWVDQYVERLERRFEDAEEVLSGWLTTDQLAELFGFTYRSMKVLAAPSCRKKYTLHKHLERIPQKNLRIRTPSRLINGRYWREQEARREAQLYNLRRQRARTRPSGAEARP